MPLDRVKTATRTPPRAMAWVLLLASAGAVLLTGLIGTTLLLGNPDASLASVPLDFWLRLGAACGLTILSLALRSLRWIFLLRRSGVRIPIRDAYLGYFAGLSLLFTPFLLGEIAVRALVHRARGGVPVATTVVVNLWERLLDLTALALIAGLTGLALGAGKSWSAILLAGFAATCTPWTRRMFLRLAVGLSGPAARWIDDGRRPMVLGLTRGRTWVVALGASVLAWVLPGVGFWWLAGTSEQAFGLLDAQHAYAFSASLGGLVLAPGGVLVTGGTLMSALNASGFAAGIAVLIVFGIRLATVGVATVLGGLCLLIHVKTAPTVSAVHFDEIADAYDVQIPESRREALLVKKTGLMRAVLEARRAGRRGLDVGCGQGAYVARMRRLGFDVSGIDASAAQVDRAVRQVGANGLVATGSVLSIPAVDASYDFVYVINVLHHLSSVDEQRRGFAELMRVLKPGGLLFVHEINTRNVLFRFYMGYVFPSLNCIDEGIERWLRPDRLDVYTDARVIDIRYFTFLPDFVPRWIVRLLAPVERLLERSRYGIYSAHYMAVLTNAGHTGNRRVPDVASG